MENAIHLFQSGGPVMYPLLALSIITIAIGIERFYYYHVNRKGSKTFARGLYDAADRKDWNGIEQLCRKYPSSLSRIVGAGMRSAGDEAEMKGAFEGAMTQESILFGRYLDYLSAIVTISPLLGLLGTVTGMIRTFSVLDAGAGAAGITGGVGEALVATATGLCVAIIAFCFYTCFSHQIGTMVSDSERLCTKVIDAKRESWAEA